MTDKPDYLAALTSALADREALIIAQQFLLRPLRHVLPSTGSEDAWVDARQFALWTVEKALGTYPDHVQRARDEWMAAYLAQVAR